MVEPETVVFESQGVPCEADLHTPSDGEPPWPVVVMAHGFGAKRSWGLAPFAAGFAEAGLAALVFDHRHLGGSGGEPRRLIAPSRQLEDWDAAVTHARTLDAVDPDRVALWGTSFSGGHVLATAARRDDVSAVVAQVPFVDGPATFAHMARQKGPADSLRQTGRALADRLAALAGRDPVEVPIVSRPGGGGLMDTPGALEAYRALVPEAETMVNRTPARVVVELPFYRPGHRAADIDVPVHVVIAVRDAILPVEATERVVERLRGATVHRVPAGHFAVYQQPWRKPVVEEQVGFLVRATGGS